MSLKVVDAAELTELRTAGKPVVVDFYADWCGPCRAIGPEIETLASSTPDTTFVKLDVDANPELAVELGVMGIPTVIHFASDGSEVARSTGLRRSAALASALGIDAA